MKNKKKLILISSLIVGIPLLAVSTNAILKQARDNYYKEQKIKIELEKAQQKAQREQELAQQRAQKEKLAAQEREQMESNKKDIRIVDNKPEKQKDVAPKVQKKMTSQEKDNEKVKQVIANVRKEVKPVVAYEPVSNVVAKSELTAKDRARARKALKEIRAEYFAKNKSQKLKNNETLIVKTSNEGIETKKYSNAEIQKVLKEIRANYKK